MLDAVYESWETAPNACQQFFKAHWKKLAKSSLQLLLASFYFPDDYCNHALTPLDPNIRLSKRDSPEAVDPRLHRHMRSIVGCLSYLVNMTRPDLAFAYSQLSKFLQSPGPIHLAAAERTLGILYLRGTYNEGITYFDPGPESRKQLTGWVDSDFAADPDTRKSMIGYVFSLNGGAVSWRSSRQGGVTLTQNFTKIGVTWKKREVIIFCANHNSCNKETESRASRLPARSLNRYRHQPCGALDTGISRVGHFQVPNP